MVNDILIACTLTDGSYTCGEPGIMYKPVESLRCTPDSNGICVSATLKYNI